MQIGIRENGHNIGSTFGCGYFMLNHDIICEEDDYEVTFEKGDIVYAYSDIDAVSEKEYIYISTLENKKDNKILLSGREYFAKCFVRTKDISSLEYQMEDEVLDEKIEEKISHSFLSKIVSYLNFGLIGIGILLLISAIIIIATKSDNRIMTPIIIGSCVYFGLYFILMLIKAFKFVHLKGQEKLNIEKQIFSLKCTGDEPSVFSNNEEEVAE
jgi:hypothetical protein